jgi:hypothetical protein
MISEMETIQILSSKLRNEELENDDLTRQKFAQNTESKYAGRNAVDVIP